MLVVDSRPTLELYRERGSNSLLRHHSTRPTLRCGPRSWQASRHGATVGQVAEKPTAWSRWAERAAADLRCGPGRARAKLGKPCSRRAVVAAERSTGPTTRGPLNHDDGQRQAPSPAQRPSRARRTGRRDEARTRRRDEAGGRQATQPQRRSSSAGRLAHRVATRQLHRLGEIASFWLIERQGSHAPRSKGFTRSWIHGSSPGER